MKKIKILFPVISFSSIAIMSIASITSCNGKKTEDDGYKAIPIEKLNLELGDLNGLKDPNVALTDYDKLTIPSAASSVTGFSYVKEPKPTIAYESIKKIDFEGCNSRCDIDTNAFTSLPNLKIIEFPVDCSKITLNEDSIYSCKQLSIIDFSKSNNDFNATFYNFVWAASISTSGVFYANENNKTRVEIIRDNLGLNLTWTIEIKK